MKKTVALILSLSMSFALSACGSQNSGNTTGDIPFGSISTETVGETGDEAPEETAAEAAKEAPAEVSADEPESTEGKALVVYYSATGNTEEAAGYIVAETGADMHELVPVEPYTDEDLNYNDDSSRVVYDDNRNAGGM